MTNVISKLNGKELLKEGNTIVVEMGNKDEEEDCDETPSYLIYTQKL